MKKHRIKYIKELLGFALVNNGDKFHIMISYSGHVDQVYIDVHLGGWVKGKAPDLIRSFYVDDEKEFKSESVLKELVELKKQS